MNVGLCSNGFSIEGERLKRYITTYRSVKVIERQRKRDSKKMVKTKTDRRDDEMFTCMKNKIFYFTKNNEYKKRSIPIYTSSLLSTN